MRVWDLSVVRIKRQTSYGSPEALPNLLRGKHSGTCQLHVAIRLIRVRDISIH